MKLLSRIYQQIFWKQLYRDALRVSTIGDEMYLEGLPSAAKREAKGVIAYYQVYGPRQHLTPREAAYRALVEFGDKFRSIGISVEEEDRLAAAIYYFDPENVPKRWDAAALRAVASIRERMQRQEQAEAALQRLQRDWSADHKH